MQILVTGGHGTLGSALQKEAKRQDITLYTPSHSEFDITNLTQCKKYIILTKPSTIINCAAITDLLLCEQKPSLAMRVNVDGVVNLVKLANIYNLKLIHISSHAVFGQDTSNYLYESTTPVKPIKVYACSKYLAEKACAVIANNDSLIIRLGWLINNELKNDKKFLGKLLGQIKLGSKILEVVNDTMGTITLARDTSRKILEYACGNAYGIRHLVNRGKVTRYELASYFFKHAGLNNITIKPVPSTFFSSASLLTQQKSCLASHYKSSRLPHWQNGMDELILQNKLILDTIRQE